MTVEIDHLQNENQFAKATTNSATTQNKKHHNSSYNKVTCKIARNEHTVASIIVFIASSDQSIDAHNPYAINTVGLFFPYIELFNSVTSIVDRLRALSTVRRTVR